MEFAYAMTPSSSVPMTSRTAHYEEQAARNWTALREAWAIHAELYDRIEADFAEPPTEMHDFTYALTTTFKGKTVLVEGRAFGGPSEFPVQINAEVVSSDDGKPGEFLFAIEEWDLFEDFPVEDEPVSCDSCDNHGCEACWRPCGGCKGYLNAWGECSWCKTGGAPDHYEEPCVQHEFEVCDAIRGRLEVKHEVVGDTVPG